MLAASNRGRAGAERLLASYVNWNRSYTAVRQAGSLHLLGLAGQSAGRGGPLQEAYPAAGAVRGLARWIQQHAGEQVLSRGGGPAAVREQLRAGAWRHQHLRGLAARAGGRPDIGARVRALQQKRLWNLALGGSLVAGFVILALNTFNENLMFYITPTQALEKFAEEPSRNRFRLGGLVLEGSVRHFANAAEMEFVVTDLATEILVRYRGSLPDLFREGHSVVAEGFLKPLTELEAEAEASVPMEEGASAASEVQEGARSRGCFFAAAAVLAKHDEKYMPKEVAAAVARNKAAIEAAEGGAPGEAGAPLPAPALTRQPPRPSKLSKVGQAPPQAQQYEITS